MMIIKTYTSSGKLVDCELDDSALAYSAKCNDTSIEAVVLAIKTYDEIGVHCHPDTLPGPEMARRLEVDGDWAIGLVSDFIQYEIDWLEGY